MLLSFNNKQESVRKLNPPQSLPVQSGAQSGQIGVQVGQVGQSGVQSAHAGQSAEVGGVVSSSAQTVAVPAAAAALASPRSLHDTVSPTSAQAQALSDVAAVNYGANPKAVPKKKSSGLQSLIARAKKVKNIEIYLAVAMIVVMIAIYMTTLSPKPKASASANTKTGSDYARELETRLAQTLSQISGAGRVNVMVTLASSSTLELAWNIDEKTVTQAGSGGVSSTTTTIVKTPVIVNGQPLVLYEIMPKVKGIVIVASGAGDIAVRLNLLRAVQTLIVDTDIKLDIFTGK